MKLIEIYVITQDDRKLSTRVVLPAFTEDEVLNTVMVEQTLDSAWEQTKNALRSEGIL